MEAVDFELPDHWDKDKKTNLGIVIPFIFNFYRRFHAENAHDDFKKHLLEDLVFCYDSGYNSGYDQGFLACKELHFKVQSSIETDPGDDLNELFSKSYWREQYLDFIETEGFRGSHATYNNTVHFLGIKTNYFLSSSYEQSNIFKIISTINETMNEIRNQIDYEKSLDMNKYSE